MITPDQVQDIRGMLTEACELHIADGGYIISNGFADADKGLCPIGCLAGDPPGEVYVTSIVKLLGLQNAEMLWDFIHAFDNVSNYPATRSPLAALGRELRDKYIGKST